MWINELLSQITSFLPRPILIRPDEAGFRMTPKPFGGSWLKEMDPGNWYWFIPLLQEHEVCKTKTQVVDVRIQSCFTKDGENVCVGVSIRYYVQNPIKALLEVHNYDESLQNTSLGVVSDFIDEHSFEELKNSRLELKSKLLEAVRKEASGWGLRVQSIKITDLGKAQNFRILMNDSLGFTLSE